MKKTLRFSRPELMSVFKNALGTIHSAVEVGTYQGEFAKVMINKLQPTVFHAVDPLRLFPGMNSNPGSEFESQDKLDALAVRVANKLADSNAVFIRDISEEASKQFEDDSLDVVYLDGDHSYKGCAADISYWYPKIRKGGILAGHDYCEGNKAKGHVYGVIQAVDELVEAHNLNLWITSEAYASWFVFKDNKVSVIED
jgi:hypothetical protein